MLQKKESGMTKTYMFTDEQSFISAFHSGEEDAFRYLYDKFYTSLCIFAYRLTGDDAFARDAVQETFIKLWEDKEHFQAEGAIRSFLYIVVRNAALNQIKHLKMQENNLKKMDSDEMENSAIDLMIRQEAERQLAKMLDLLPMECRRVVKLLAEGKSYKEVAEVLHISPNTVKNHRIKAIKILRGKVNPFYLFIYL